MLSTEMATDEKNHSSPDDQPKEEEKAAVAREDAVDISL